MIRSERAAKSGQAKNYAAYLTFCGKCGKMGLSWGMGGRGLVVVGTLVARLTPPSPMGRWENGKKWEKKGKREKGKRGKKGWLLIN